MENVIVIGAGINGLVAANYLRRAGCEVTLLEKKDSVGGACAWDTFRCDGKEYAFPSGASVFGMMQDFVFRETGLDERVSVYRPKHPALVYFGNEAQATRELDEEFRTHWGEQGDLTGYRDDLEKVRTYLLQGYRTAEPPTWEGAVAAVGETLARRWISGSAHDLLNHYFTSDRMKIFKSMSVNESGPVPFDEPYTAFNFPVLSSGSVFDGSWGFVKGGLWQIPRELGDLNRIAGVKVRLGVDIQSVDGERREVKVAGETLRADAIFFATDPVTAAKLLGDTELSRNMALKKKLGSSGKVVLFFREPVTWKGNASAADDFSAAFRFLYAKDSFGAFQKSNDAVRGRDVDFSPSAFQVYCEGAAMRRMGWNEPHDYLSVFSKDFSFHRSGKDLPEVKKAIEEMVLSRIENRDAFLGSVLRTPRDLSDLFFFPEGNIDHMELRLGQNFADRRYASNPKSDFYRLGRHENVYYCGSGSYPNGSVAGTSGYLAARQWLRPRR